MTADDLMTALHDRDVMLPLICSLLAGGLIGAEREMNRKPAGIRTHALLCFAAALMTLIGLRMNEWVVYLPEGTQIVSDMARMPHAILTGVGFLGAGVIFREGASVTGLTTAASLWLTAALGIVFGTGLMALGMIGATIAVIVLVVLRFFQRLAPPLPFARLELELEAASELTSLRLQERLRARGVETGPVGCHIDGETGLRRYDMLLSMREPVMPAEEIATLLGGAGAFQRLALAPIQGEPG